MGSKITADGDCSHVIGRCLVLRRKSMTNINSLLKSKSITLPTKVHLFKAIIFPVVIYGCESWTIKKSECRRSDAFELRCWRRLLRVPWTARRLNQWILREINHEYSLEVLILKLQLQYFGHLMWTADSSGPDAGKEWRQKEKRTTQEEMVGWYHWCNGHELGKTQGDGEGQRSLVCCSPWGHEELDTTWWLNKYSTVLCVCVHIFYPLIYW